MGFGLEQSVAAPAFVGLGTLAGGRFSGSGDGHDFGRFGAAVARAECDGGGDPHRGDGWGSGLSRRIDGHSLWTAEVHGPDGATALSSATLGGADGLDR